MFSVSISQRGTFIEAVIADILDIMWFHIMWLIHRLLEVNYPNCQCWVNISVDFAKENISKTSFFIGLFYESALVMNGFICLPEKSFRLCRSTSCNLCAKMTRIVQRYRNGLQCWILTLLFFFLENVLSLMRCGNSQAWSFLRISAAVLIGDWDKAEHSASKHLLARCRMPVL